MEEEVDIRDYIRVILRRKKLVLAVFLIGVSTTAIVDLLKPKTYEASAQIMITPSRLQTALVPTNISLDLEKGKNGSYLEPRPTISLQSHKRLLTSNEVLQEIIAKLGLKNQETGIKLSPLTLAKSLEVEEMKETNILDLKVRMSEPQKATEIATTWANVYIGFSQGLIAGEVKGSDEFINRQFKTANATLIQKEKAVRKFKDKYKLDLMQAELQIKKGKLNAYKKELINLKLSLKTKKDSLRELEKEIKDQEKFIAVSKAITDDALWQQVTQGKPAEDWDKKKLLSQEINPVYQDIEKRIVNTRIEVNTLKPKIEYLEKSCLRLKEEIDQLAKTINQKEFELTQLSREVSIAEHAYDSIASRLTDAQIARAVQLGGIKIVSSAAEPTRPIGPKKRRDVAISAVVSLLVGILLAFFVEYLPPSEAKA